MKPRLIILSDLWGIEKAEWVNNYIEILDSNYEIQFYDCCDLGKVNKSVYQENNLHDQFVKGGIETASKRLLELEKEKIDVLAFSIGGVIAWKAQLNGLKIDNLHSVSSTRLRYEKEKPSCKLTLYFGDKDNYKPTYEWFENFKLKPKMFKNKKHKLYTEYECISKICDRIKTPYNTVYN